ncbi:MAG: DUF4124 domain-containing protein [Hydrogenophilaceae bacterium]|nr:DUF4124 domain-containing protein [Hydrogenophilaceae bacterium]
MIPLLLSGVTALPVQAEIYKYIDENGQVTFTDVARKGQRAEKVYGLPSGPRTISRGTSGEGKRVSTPGPIDFPRIDSGTQKRRDDLRRTVLEEELSTERRNLDEAKRQLALAERPMPGERSSDPGYQSRVKRLRDAVENHERNIAAIQKEISTSR